MRIRCKHIVSLLLLFSAGNILHAQSLPPNPGSDPDNGTVVFNLKLFIEGYYNSGTGLMAPALFNNSLSASSTAVDTVTVELHAATGGLSTLFTTKGVLQTNGSIANVTVTSGITEGQSYYIVLKATNAVAVWSAAPVVIANNVTYDFSNAASKAYGNNMKQAGSVFMLYSGDINGDGYTDGLDYIDLDGDNSAFAFGILKTDLNGDGYVDGLDYTSLDLNSAGFTGVLYPAAYGGLKIKGNRPRVLPAGIALQSILHKTRK